MMMALTFIGDIERRLADLYPYRYPLTGLAVLACLGAALLVLRLGVYRPVLRHRLASVVVGVPLIAVMAVAGNYLLSPLWERSFLNEPSPIEAAGMQPGTALDASTKVNGPAYRGNFRGADSFHYARGKALLLETGPGQHVLRLEDFSVRNGPNLYVYLSTGPTNQVDERLNLGRLKATDGAFNYELSPDIDPRAVTAVVVWCREFGVLFGAAELEKV
jgi:hypothetical protein